MYSLYSSDVLSYVNFLCISLNPAITLKHIILEVAVFFKHSEIMLIDLWLKIRTLNDVLLINNVIS